jgi:O-antigen/teichoic acid export membrane protein
VSSLWQDWLLKASGEAGRKLLAFLAVSWIARRLGDAGFGELVYVMTFTGMIMILPQFGLQTLVAREVAARRAAAGEILGAALRARLLLIPPYLLLVLVAARFTRLGDAPAAAGLFAVFWLAEITVELLGACLMGLGRFRDEALLQVSSKLLLLAGAVIVVTRLPRLSVVAAVYLGAAGGALLAGLRLLKVRGIRIRPPQPGAVRRFLAQALPLTLTAFFTLLYFKVDILMLRRWHDPAVVGRYGAAYRIFELSMSVPATLTAALFPRLSRLARGNRPGFDALFTRGLLIAGLAALPTAGLVALAAPAIVRIAFGPEFAAAGRLLRILCVSLVLVFVNYVVIYTLTARNLQAVHARAAAICLAANVIMNAIWIPAHGAPAAAWTTAATEAVLLGLTLPAALRRERP